MGSPTMLVFPPVASASLNGDKVQAVVSERELLNFLSRRLSPKTPGEVGGSKNGGYVMLWTIFVVLLVLWLLGLVTSYTLYGYIHLLLVIAIVVLLIQLIQGRRAL